MSDRVAKWRKSYEGTCQNNSVLPKDTINMMAFYAGVSATVGWMRGQVKVMSAFTVEDNLAEVADEIRAHTRHVVSTQGQGEMVDETQSKMIDALEVLADLLPTMQSDDEEAQGILRNLEQAVVALVEWSGGGPMDDDDLEFRPTGEMDDVTGEWYAVYHKGKRVHEICANDADHARRIFEQLKEDE